MSECGYYVRLLGYHCFIIERNHSRAVAKTCTTYYSAEWKHRQLKYFLLMSTKLALPISRFISIDQDRIEERMLVWNGQLSINIPKPYYNNANENLQTDNAEWKHCQDMYLSYYVYYLGTAYVLLYFNLCNSSLWLMQKLHAAGTIKPIKCVY